MGKFSRQEIDDRSTFLNFPRKLTSTFLSMTCQNLFYYGIYIASDCSWHKHIEYVKSKAWSRINVMRKFKYTLDRKSLETIYIYFVRPVLEYADVVWDNCTQQEKHEIEKIQLEAARIATGTTKLVSVQKLYDEIGWETLDVRRRKHKLVLFYKMYNDIAPLISLHWFIDLTRTLHVTVCVTQII